MWTIAGGIVLGGIALFVLGVVLSFGLTMLDGFSGVLLSRRLKKRRVAAEWVPPYNEQSPHY
jgi:hypothetical protein